MSTRRLFGLCLAAALAAGAWSATPAAAEQSETQRSLAVIAKRLEKGVKKFSKRFDKELDKSLLEGTRIEQAVDKRADKLAGAMDGVAGKVRKDRYSEARERLDRALQLAHDVNRVMEDRRFSERLELEWDALRADINVLAMHFGLEPL